MHNVQKNLIPAAILAFFYASGLWVFAHEHLAARFSFTTPWFVLATGLLTIIPALKEGGRKLLVWVAAAAVLTFLIEAAGVATGKIFGVYHYGPGLGFSLLGVPLLIGLNWVVVTLGAYALLSRLRLPGAAILVLTAFTITLFDVFLEAGATHPRLGYWAWQNGLIPLQNYVAWFATALVITLPLVLMKIRLKTTLTPALFLLQWLYFVILGIVLP